MDAPALLGTCHPKAVPIVKFLKLKIRCPAHLLKKAKDELTFMREDLFAFVLVTVVGLGIGIIGLVAFLITRVTPKDPARTALTQEGANKAVSQALQQYIASGVSSVQCPLCDGAIVFSLKNDTAAAQCLIKQVQTSCPCKACTAVYSIPT